MYQQNEPDGDIEVEVTMGPTRDVLKWVPSTLANAVRTGDLCEWEDFMRKVSGGSFKPTFPLKATFESKSGIVKYVVTFQSVQQILDTNIGVIARVSRDLMAGGRA